MARLGFRLVLTTDPVPETARSFPFVVDDVAWTRRYGYGLAFERVAAAGRATDPNETYFRGLSPQRRVAALRAFNGDPANGVSVHPAQRRHDRAQRRGLRQHGATRRLRRLSDLVPRRQGRPGPRGPSESPGPARLRIPGGDGALGRVRRHRRAALRDAGGVARGIAGLGTEGHGDPVRRSRGDLRTQQRAGPNSRDLQRRYLDQLRAEHHDAVATARQRRLQALPTARKLLAASTARP